MQQLKAKDLLIIGAGPAGLKAAEEAERYGLDYTILDKGDVGQGWRTIRKDMRLLSPCHPQRDWTSLSNEFPIWKQNVDRPYCTSSQFVNYLQKFAEHFGLNIQTNTEVKSVHFDDGRYLVNTGSDTNFIAGTVLVANGLFGNPYIPPIPGAAQNPIVSHSHDYSGVNDFEKQRVLIVGAGNSAAEIAIELAGKSMVYLCYRGELSFFSKTQNLHNIRGISESYLKELIKMEIVRFYGQHDLIEIKGNRAIFKDRVLEVDKIIFATGYRPELNILDSLKLQSNEFLAPEITMTGESLQYPGLFFAGPIAFQTPSSIVIHGFIKNISKTMQRINERIKNQPVQALLENEQQTTTTIS